MHEHIRAASESLDAPVSALPRVADYTASKLSDFRELAGKRVNSNPEVAKDLAGAGLVLFGSFARQELTAGSDCDYAILQSGCNPDTSRQLAAIAEGVAEKLSLKPPGPQGIFGRIVIAANLYERIGLGSDTNENLTHRMLVLTESVPVLEPTSYNTAVEKVLQRYCADYRHPRRANESPVVVPRYLLNDLVRYWRTIAVDFGEKRWRAVGNESPLRLIKLRTTRKILFAGSLCTLLLVPLRVGRTDDLPEYLRSWLAKPPLAQLLSIVTDPKLAEDLQPSTKEALRNLLRAYDRILEVLDHRRRDLESPDEHSKEIVDECGLCGETIQNALEVVFFDEPILSKSVRTHGVF